MSWQANIKGESKLIQVEAESFLQATEAIIVLGYTDEQIIGLKQV